MTTRHYSSFLLRFWSVNGSDAEMTPNSTVLQIQHLQTGVTWKLNSLEELNKLLNTALGQEGLAALSASTISDSNLE